jgi:aspartyl-tRNA(Asn)/glutamyl-tRNA(Gln) amidotransferase subunit A
MAPPHQEATALRAARVFQERTAHHLAVPSGAELSDVSSGVRGTTPD